MHILIISICLYVILQPVFSVNEGYRATWDESSSLDNIKKKNILRCLKKRPKKIISIWTLQFQWNALLHVTFWSFCESFHYVPMHINFLSFDPSNKKMAACSARDICSQDIASWLFCLLNDRWTSMRNQNVSEISLCSWKHGERASSTVNYHEDHTTIDHACMITYEKERKHG